jgi:hypothetical protein
MSDVLTTASQLECAHGGKLQVQASQSTLTVDGKAVLLESDILAATISGCKTPITPPPPGPTQKPCLKVTGLTAGRSKTLSVGGGTVVLASAQGTTDGLSTSAPPQWSVKDVKQTKLEAG